MEDSRQVQPGSEYTVQPNDTLVDIAHRAYNDSSESAWRVIYDANKDVIGDDPNLIRPGATLFIPGITAGKTYTVQSGDTLSSIAEKFYGDSSESCWRRIYDANKDVIGDNPNLIRDGEVLSIP